MLEDYIKTGWERLLRNSLDVALDPKVNVGMRSYLYIPADEDPAAINLMIHERRQLTENSGAIEVIVLPENLIVTENHGILYLPYDYIVPGGRFNEMYGWDSYWIILGLLQDGYVSIAQGMVENFIYEIRHYGGKVLNANRTYYLSRAHPPMLALMTLAVLPFVEASERLDFLQRAADATALEYEGFWKTHRYQEELGLFHYGHRDQGELGPCPEVAFGERDDTGLSHYDKITAYLRELAPTELLRQRFFDPEKDALTPEAIAGDRAMRESGFDTSMHMGYYGLETMDYSPVCLNSLLTMQCQLLGQSYRELGQKDRAAFFENEAAQLQAAIHKYMWNDEAKRFTNFNHYKNEASLFLYLTSVYPLWAGIATAEQARCFRDQLALFETEYGLTTTDQCTGCQWDAPFMWAPLVYFTVAGLRNYGFIAEATRIGQKFIATVQRVNEKENANFEKYNAASGTHRTEDIIEVGYSENVVGFGWTNGAARALQAWMEQDNKNMPPEFSVAVVDKLTAQG